MLRRKKITHGKVFLGLGRKFSTSHIEAIKPMSLICIRVEIFFSYFFFSIAKEWCFEVEKGLINIALSGLYLEEGSRARTEFCDINKHMYIDFICRYFSLSCLQSQGSGSWPGVAGESGVWSVKHDEIPESVM